MTDIANLRFNITTNGGQAIRNMDRVGRRANALSRSFGGLGTAIATVVVQRAVAQAARLADEYSNVNAQVKLVAQSQADVVKLQRGALANAISTRNSFAASGTIIARLGRSAQRFGGSTEQVLEVSKAIQETFRVSGATVRESEAATLQLAQALGKGVLNGDELRSVLENNLFISQVIADEFGVSVDELKELGAAGELVSSRVFKALLEDAGEINKAFESIPKTFGDSAAVAQTTFQVLFGEVNKQLGISEGLFRKVSEISQDFLRGDGLIEAVTTFAKLRRIINDIARSFTFLRLKFAEFVQQSKIAINNLFDINNGRNTKELTDQFRALAAERDELLSRRSNPDRGFFEFVDAQKRIEAIDVLLKDLRVKIRGTGEASNAELKRVQDEIQELIGGQTTYLSEQDKLIQNAKDGIIKASEEINRAFEAQSNPVSTTLGFETNDPNFVGGVDLFGGAEGIGSKAAKNAEAIGALYKSVFEDVQAVGTNAFGNMFNEAENGFEAMAKAFVGTWLNALKDIIASRLATQFAELLLGNGSTPTGGFRGLVGALGGLFGGENAGAGVPINGFRNGTNFRVGGNGGPDSQRVSFLATPNERVSVQTPAQQRGNDGSGVQITQNLSVAAGVSPAEFEQAMIRQRKEIVAEMQQRRNQGRF